MVFSSLNLLLDFGNLYLYKTNCSNRRLPCFKRCCRSFKKQEPKEGRYVNPTSPSSSLPINLNVLSAGVHVLSDTLRSISVFLAAGLSKIFHLRPDVCDDGAGIAVGCTIMVSCFVLGREIWDNRYNKGIEGGGYVRSIDEGEFFETNDIGEGIREDEDLGRGKVFGGLGSISEDDDEVWTEGEIL